MAWKKLDRIAKPDAAFERFGGWMSYPAATLLSDRVRVFYSPRTSENRSVIAYTDLDRNDIFKIIGSAEKPVLEAGALGCFDDCGVQPMQTVHVGEELWLYYLGWNPAANGVARNATGLAVSRDDGVTFERAYQGPILDRSRDEPYFSFTPWVLRDSEGWRMWYATGTAWELVNDKPEGTFELRDAYSEDGVEWRRPNRRILPPARPDEVMCKPNVVRRQDGYHMWYSFRSNRDFRGGVGSYKIGYAHSPDGHVWTREDTVGGLDCGEDGAWDSEMVCFSSVLEIDGRVLLFYTGNGFGRTGFGVAEWE